MYLAAAIHMVVEASFWFYPPNQWVKPEASFNHHVYGRGQIVATTNVPHFVRENGFQVRIFKAFGNAFRPHQDWPGDAENPRFQGSPRHEHLDPLPYPPKPLQLAQRIHFASFS